MSSGASLAVHRRALYKWSTPLLAERFLRYSPTPVSRSAMTMNTASGVIVVLTRD
jgi:hypothetical protein